MRNRQFRPSLNDVLEDRLAMSQIVPIGTTKAPTAHPTPTPPPVPALRTGALNDVNGQIDVAFAQFGRAYRYDFLRFHKSGNQAGFRSGLAAGASKLRQTLDSLAILLPGSNQNLATTLNNRVDSLLQGLSGNTSQSQANLIGTEQSGAQSDLAAYVQSEVARGAFTLR